MGDIEAVLFDFGNTLFAHADLPTTIAGAAAQLGLHITDGDAATMASRIDAAAMAADEIAEHPRDLDPVVWSARWRVLYGMADALGPGLGEAVHASMHHPLEWHPYRDTERVLRGLAERGIDVGVVSNTGWDVRAPLRARGLDAVVRSFTLSYEAGAVKPQRAIFEMACAALGRSPGRVLMVGDDPIADAGAVRCGLRVLLLPAQPPSADNGLAAVLDISR